MHPYEVLKRPVITEKSGVMQDIANQYVFQVDRRANKLQVKQAVEERFDVEVIAVNIVSMKAKTRRRGRQATAVRVAPWKKAIVTLASGDSIQMFEGV
ncbi:MAG: 50S ribosomal protein L23 [Caldilineales bacterium]|nr:50S ribosomal protein L23 [Caldilineales bacterium]